MPEPKSHADRRPWLEQLLRKVPGFRGYLERDYRRESDALQRKLVCDRLLQAKRPLDTLGGSLVDARQLDDLPQLDRLRARLDQLAGRIGGAMQGYSGMFDLVQVNEQLLDRAYQCDLDLLAKVEQFVDSVEQQAPSGAPAGETFRKLLQELEDVERVWSERATILQGLD